MNVYLAQQQMISCFYLALSEKYKDIISLCYKLGNYEYLHPYIEQIAKDLSYDVNAMFKIFYERNPLYPDVMSVKEMIEFMHSKIRKVITKEEIDLVMKSKDDIISSMTLIIKEHERSIEKLVSAKNDYEKCIEELQSELQKKKLQILALNKDTYFCPSLKSSLEVSEGVSSKSLCGLTPSSLGILSYLSSSPDFNIPSLQFWKDESLTF